MTAIFAIKAALLVRGAHFDGGGNLTTGPAASTGTTASQLAASGAPIGGRASFPATVVRSPVNSLIGQSEAHFAVAKSVLVAATSVVYVTAIVV